MDLTRKIGIAIVMFIPAFVFAGLLYQLFGSYILAFFGVIIVGGIYGGIITGKISEFLQKARQS